MKIIHAPELHLNPETQEKVFTALEKLIEYTSKEKHLVVFTGDFFDRAVQNTDRSGITKAIELVKQLSKQCVIVMQYGTRSSHDIEGCYEVFKPYATIMDKDTVVCNAGDYVLYSLPEIMPSDVEISGDIQDCILDEGKKRCEKMICALPEKTICIGHGTVLSESTLKNPAIEKAGKYHYKEDWLQETGINLFLFGHLHFPYRFKNVNGGYVGSLAHNYKDTGFKPGFDVYGEDLAFVERVDLPFCGRQTIDVKVVDGVIDVEGVDVPEGFTIRPNVTISQNDNTSLKKQEVVSEVQKLYPHCVVDRIHIKQITSSKVRTSEVTRVNTYREMYKLYDPSATEEDLIVQDELEKEDIALGVIPKKTNIQLKTVKVKGYKLLTNSIDRELVFDVEKYGVGVFALVARGGFGKSAMSDLLYPHPECLSKPYPKSQLFDDNGYIKQVYDVDGDTVETSIFGNPNNVAHRVCVNGNELCKKNMREYKEIVNKIFGSLQSVTISCISSQKQQARIVDGVNPDPDLFTADNSTMKTLYNVFCGSDKTATQKRCKEKKDKLKTEIEVVLSEKRGVEKMLEDMSVIDTTSIEARLEDLLLSKKTSEDYIKEKTAIVDGLVESQKAAEESKKVYEKACSDFRDAKEDVQSAEQKFLSISSSIIDDKESVKKAIETAEELKARNKKAEEHNKKTQAEYNKEVELYQNRLDDFNEVAYKNSNNKNAVIGLEKDVNSNLVEIGHCKFKIDNIKPCPKCGYVDSCSNEIIESSKKEIEELEKENSLLEQKIENIAKEILSKSDLEELHALIIKPTLSLQTVEPEEDVTELLAKLTDSDNAEKVLPDYIKMLEDAKAKEKDIESQLSKLKAQIQTDNADTIKALSNNIQQVENDLKHMSNEIDSLNKTLAEQESKKQLASDIEQKIFAYTEQIESLELEKNRWERYEKAWSKNGIPARFIEIYAPSIDETANNLLAQFYPTFQVETLLTKDDGKGKVMDTFDIMCFNAEKSESYTIRALSGEQGNFVKTALYYAFRKQYIETTGRKFNFLFLDEQDYHVCQEMQPAFFEMIKYIQEDLSNTLICVSHSAEAPNNIDNVINFEEL